MNGDRYRRLGTPLLHGTGWHRPPFLCTRVMGPCLATSSLRQDHMAAWDCISALVTSGLLPSLAGQPRYSPLSHRRARASPGSRRSMGSWLCGDQRHYCPRLQQPYRGTALGKGHLSLPRPHGKLPASKCVYERSGGFVEVERGRGALSDLQSLP